MAQSIENLSEKRRGGGRPRGSLQKNATYPRDPDLELVIARLDGPTGAAEYFGIALESVCGWRHNGLPEARELRLKLERPDVLVGTRWEVKTEPQEA
ncbi:MAG: hypothetical protein ACTHJ9_17230 [Rhodanobacter sp.]